MTNEQKAQIAAPIRNFSLPSYTEIPDVGLYLEQTSKFITEILAPLGEEGLTRSMISNYVKKKLIVNPVKKQYSREQIAYLIAIAVLKTVLPLEDIQLLFDQQKQSYTPRRAYEYFCAELENVLQYVFGLKNELAEVGVDNTDEKMLLRSAIFAVSYKAFLTRSGNVLRGKKED